jgi:chromate transporter
MIQDLVQSQSLISLSDFLSGYAIDQAIPGPLFSFAAFVAARSFETSPLALGAGILGGFSIFLPGILLVFFISPLWKSMRQINRFSSFLKGVTITATAIITMTALTQIIQLPFDLTTYGVLLAGFLLLITKKIPAPLIVIVTMLVGLLM